MKLREIAHSRTGDKGDISNISLIPYDERNYGILCEAITADIVKEFFSDICKGSVTRYELPGVNALNFVLDKTLGGGVTRSLAIDKHGKSLGMALLEMELPEQFEDKVIRSMDIVSASDIAVGLNGKTVRIGGGAGYAGDRLEPALELMEKGDLDYIIFECLAERTIAIGQSEKQKDPSRGYNSLLEYRMKRLLPLAAMNNIKIITNMGSANPEGAAVRTAEIARELGVADLKIAYVEGDDIFDRLDLFCDQRVLETGALLKDSEIEAVSANAYMGSDGIVEALEKGADVIITGRVSDPALTLGPLIYEFRWDAESDPDKTGMGVLAGHLLECAGQITGGYYADPGIKDIPSLDKLGFPIAEISENGELMITKVGGSGGRVDPDTCKEQLIYEIHDPSAYLTPDAIADFTNVSFVQAGKDSVFAAGATAHGIPKDLKVSIGYRDCYIGEGEISYGGSTALERARLAAAIVMQRAEDTGIEFEESRIDYIGYNSLYRDRISGEISQEKPDEVRLRISVRTKDRESARRLAGEVETLYTNGPAGGGGASGKVTEVLSVCSIFVPRETCKAEVHFVL